MSSEQKLTKKQKKALAFRERKGKGKAKALYDIQDVPVEENQDLAEIEAEDISLEDQTKSEAPSERPAKKATSAADKPDRIPVQKRKRSEDKEVAQEADEKQSKKKRKDNKGVAVDADTDAEQVTKGGAKQRYILFVGNLQYRTTKEAVQEHFSKCDPPPSSVRLMTPKPSQSSKPTTKSKGFAFIEFNSRNAMQQALKLHQSVLEGRNINVELTAGGGGKSESRLQKLKERNRALHEERTKRSMKQKSAQGKKSDGVDVDLERPQRFSTTSGVGEVPRSKRTWTVDDGNADEKASGRIRGKKNKKRVPKALGTGVNAIPVG